MLPSPIMDLFPTSPEVPTPSSAWSPPATQIAAACESLHPGRKARVGVHLRLPRRTRVEAITGHYPLDPPPEGSVVKD